MENAGLAWHTSQMSYTAEIVLADTVGPDSDQGIPGFRLPKAYPSAESACDTARAYIGQLGRPMGGAWYLILDDHDREVGLAL